MLQELLKIAVLAVVLHSVNVKANEFMSEDSIFKEPPVPVRKSTRAVVLEYIEQRVDNFDPQNHDTWQMRYYRNDEFFKPGGPIFIYVGGEWTISSGWILGGHMYDMAEELNGQMYYTEHRYYGRSYPTPNASTENFKFLSVEQALADLAHFIVQARKEPGQENSKVILVGASYAATMVVWFRQKYPHLAVGSWASSAPVLAQLDQYEYKEVVGAAVRHVGGVKCHQRIENAFQEAEALVEHSDFEKLVKTFRLCEPFDSSNHLEIWRTFGTLGSSFSGTVQYHWPGDIESACEDLVNTVAENSTDLNNFAKWYIDRYFDDDDECFQGDYMSSIQYYQNIVWGQGATSSSRQWFYQTCSEFGWYHTTNSQFQPFGSHLPVEYSIQRCSDIFGDHLFNKEKMNYYIERKNTIFGGLNPGVKNVYFTHGLIDPWRTMGVQTDLNIHSPANVIPTGSHCQDLYSITIDDTTEMRNVKLRIKSLVWKWLGKL